MTEEKGKKGRKPLSITYVFENQKYLNILFLLYYCSLFRKKQKKKFLKKALVIDQFLEFGYKTKQFDSSYYFPDPEYEIPIRSDDIFGKYKTKRRSRKHKKSKKNVLWSIEEVMMHRTAVTVYHIILQKKRRQYDLGFLDKKEFDEFVGTKPEQFYYDNLFDNEKQLTKYLGVLKNKLLLIKNYHDNRGTYWDITWRGYREIQKLELLIQIDDLFDNHFDYYTQNKEKIEKVLNPMFPPYSLLVPPVLFESLFKTKNV